MLERFGGDAIEDAQVGLVVRELRAMSIVGPTNSSYWEEVGLLLPSMLLWLELL